MLNVKLGISYFRRGKSGSSLKEKNVPEKQCSLKKKKGLHFKSVLNFLIFVSKNWCSLRKKGLHLILELLGHNV